MTFRYTSPTSPDLTERPAWHQHAACRGKGPDLFFLGKGEPCAATKAICAACPVKAECLEAGLDPREQWGVWGGVTVRERIQIRKQRDQERTAERRAS